MRVSSSRIELKLNWPTTKPTPATARKAAHKKAFSKSSFWWIPCEWQKVAPAAVHAALEKQALLGGWLDGWPSSSVLFCLLLEWQTGNHALVHPKNAETKAGLLPPVAEIGAKPQTQPMSSTCFFFYVLILFFYRKTMSSGIIFSFVFHWHRVHNTFEICVLKQIRERKLRWI